MRCEAAVIHIVRAEDNIPILIGEDFSNLDDTYIFYIKITFWKSLFGMIVKDRIITEDGFSI